MSHIGGGHGVKKSEKYVSGMIWMAPKTVTSVKLFKRYLTSFICIMASEDQISHEDIMANIIYLH